MSIRPWRSDRRLCQYTASTAYATCVENSNNAPFHYKPYLGQSNSYVCLDTLKYRSRNGRHRKQYSGETTEDAHDHDMQIGSPNLVTRASLDK